MKWIIDLITIMINEGKKSKAIKISISTIIVIVLASLFVGKTTFIYKERIDKIPQIEKNLQDCMEAIKMLPDMKDDVKWLVRRQGGTPTEEKRINKTGRNR